MSPRVKESVSFLCTDFAAPFITLSLDGDVMLGDKIRARRERRRLTQGVLAKRVGVSEKTVLRWEKGRQVPQGHEVRKALIAVLGLHWTDFPSDESPSDVRLLTSRVEALEARLSSLSSQLSELQDSLRGPRGDRPLR